AAAVARCAQLEGADRRPLGPRRAGGEQSVHGVGVGGRPAALVDLLAAGHVGASCVSGAPDLYHTVHVPYGTCTRKRLAPELPCWTPRSTSPPAAASASSAC